MLLKKLIEIWGTNLKKKYLLLVIIIVTLLGSLILYLKTHPPLSTNGITYYPEDDTKRVVEIENSGLVNIKLNTVLINGKDEGKVELGVSRSNHMVMGSGLDEDPNITFHAIDEFPIKPQSKSKGIAEKINQVDLQSIKLYGIRIFGQEEPKVVTIKYTYLGIPFSIEVDVVNK